MKRLGSEISKSNPDLAEFLRKSTAKHGVVAPIQEFLRSPVIQGYRNKCEFSIGYMNTEHQNTEKKATEDKMEEIEAKEDVNDVKMEEIQDECKTIKPTISVGFRLASYKQGKL